MYSNSNNVKDLDPKAASMAEESLEGDIIKKILKLVILQPLTMVTQGILLILKFWMMKLLFNLLITLIEVGDTKPENRIKHTSLESS